MRPTSKLSSEHKLRSIPSQNNQNWIKISISVCIVVFALNSFQAYSQDFHLNQQIGDSTTTCVGLAQSDSFLKLGFIQTRRMLILPLS